MNKTKILNRNKKQRIGRVRALVSGTAERPRLVVHRTNRYFYAQLVDDTKHATLLSVTNLGSAKKDTPKADMKTTKIEQAFAIGEVLGAKAIAKGITQVVFDRRSYQFHGRVKSFADGAKKGGLKI